MEASAIKHMGAAGVHGRSPLLRLQSDERLVTLVRRGNQHAFEALVSRYQARLLAFCRHMLSSREDAEDVLQEVFTAAFNAMLADDRPINVRPWLYRIARNRSLNHLRRVRAIGVDSMDVHFSEHGISTAEKVHRREDFRLLVADVQELPETQKTALLLREIDALSYEQIAEAMDNTVPSVKSLLVRARVGLAEAAEARLLDCNSVRMDLAEVSEGLKRMGPPVRRHLRTCTECAVFRKQLVNTNRALAALMPVGPLLLLKKTLLAHVGTTAAFGGSVAAGSTFGGALQLGIGATAQKAAVGLAAAAIMTAGAVEVKHVATERVGHADAVVVAAAAPPATTPAPPGGSSATYFQAAPVLETSPLAPTPPLAVTGDFKAEDDEPGAEPVAAHATDDEKAEPDVRSGDAADVDAAEKPAQTDPPPTVVHTDPPEAPTTPHAHPPAALPVDVTTTPLGAPGVAAPRVAPVPTQVIVHSSPVALGMPGTSIRAIWPALLEPSPVLAAPSPTLPVTDPFEEVVAPEPVIEGAGTPDAEPVDEPDPAPQPVESDVPAPAPAEPAPVPAPEDTPAVEPTATTPVEPAPAPELEAAPEAPGEATPRPADPAS